ncbi:MAG: O-antigen ligase family protein [Bacillota bacterium]|nr:O-antigen ligase family protein [Bacillota bacterium]
MENIISIIKKNAIFIALIIIALIPYNKVLPEVINPVVFIIMSALFLKYLFSKDHRAIVSSKQFKVMAIVMITLILLGFISVFLSRDKVLSFLNGFYFLSGIIVFLVVKFLKKQEVDKSIRALFYGGVMCSIASIVKYLFNSDIRLDGLLNYANASALLFAVCIVIFYFEIYKEYNSYLNRFGVLMLTIALFLTQSRGGVIVYLIALLFGIWLLCSKRRNLIIDILIFNISALILGYLLLTRQYLFLFLLCPIAIFAVFFKNEKYHIKKGVFIAIAVSIAAAIGVLVKVSFGRLTNIGIGTAQLQERFVFYEDALKLIRNNLMGIGAGTYESRQFIYQSASYGIRYIHNGFLQLAVDFGVEFLAACIIFIVYCIVQAYRNKRLRSIYFLITVMILTHSMLDFTMSFVYMNIILFMCLSIFTTANLEEEEKVSKLEKKTRRNALKDSSKLDIDNDNRLTGVSSSVRLACTVIMAVILIIVIVFIPSQVIYNAAVNCADKDDTKSAYNILKLCEVFPYEPSRYYEKLAVWSFKNYQDTKDSKYLNVTKVNIQKCLDMRKDDPRIYETAGQIDLILKEFNSAEQNFKKVKELRRFDINSYSLLLQCYENMYENKQISADQYKTISTKLSMEIKQVSKELNPKGKYMTSQLK